MNTILLDGAMGTQLIQRGVKLEPVSELVNLNHPAVVQEIHREYVEAGSGILYSCSFGANRRKLGEYASVEAIITAALRNARLAAADRAKVGLDVSMIGTLLEPYGELSESEAEELYAEQLTAGASADLFAFETYFDLNEAVLAVKTAKKLFPQIPCFATMTVQRGGKTLMGAGIEQLTAELEEAGADAIGLNCSLGPVELLPLMETMAKRTALPLIAKPNAGIPDVSGAYPMNAAEFAAAMKPILALGVAYAGGCCGTNPDYIAALRRNLA